MKYTYRGYTLLFKSGIWIFDYQSEYNSYRTLNEAKRFVDKWIAKKF